MRGRVILSNSVIINIVYDHFICGLGRQPMHISTNFATLGSFLTLLKQPFLKTLFVRSNQLVLSLKGHRSNVAQIDFFLFLVIYA